jgi:hypothetical protein
LHDQRENSNLQVKEAILVRDRKRQKHTEPFSGDSLNLAQGFKGF